MLSPEEIQTNLAFLARVQIQGNEAPVLMRLVSKLQSMVGGNVVVGDGKGLPVTADEAAAAAAASTKGGKAARRARRKSAKK